MKRTNYWVDSVFYTKNKMISVIAIQGKLAQKEAELNRLVRDCELLTREIDTLKSVLDLDAPTPAMAQTLKNSRQSRASQKKSTPAKLGANTNAGRALKYLKDSGEPKKIAEIAEALAKDAGKSAKDFRPTITSAISKYLLKGKYFIRVAEGTYGVLGRDAPTLDDLQGVA